MNNIKIELIENIYDCIQYIVGRKILYEDRILLYSEPEYKMEKEIIKKRFSCDKEVTKQYLVNIKIVSYDLTEDTITKGTANNEYLNYLLEYYDVVKLRKKYLLLEKQFKAFQQYEDNLIQKEFIDVKKQ